MPGDFHGIFLIGWRSISAVLAPAVPGQQTFELQRNSQRGGESLASNTVSNLTDLGNEAHTFRPDVFTIELTGRFYEFYSSRKCWKYGFKPELQYDRKKIDLTERNCASLAKIAQGSKQN